MAMCTLVLMSNMCTVSIRSRMGSTQSLVEETEVSQAGGGRPRLTPLKLPHQDTCESDGGMLEDIGRPARGAATRDVTQL